MKELFELRMKPWELTMRQMVAEVHQRKLNIDLAAAKFETSRKTVQHWIQKVEAESERIVVPDQESPVTPVKA